MSGHDVLARIRCRSPVMAPFDEPATELYFGGLTLGAWTAAAAAACGLRVVDVDLAASAAVGERAGLLPTGTVVVVADNVLVNAASLRRMMHVARERGPVQAAIGPGTPLWSASARLGHGVVDAPLPVDLWAGPLGGRVLMSRLDRLELATAEGAPAGVVVVADEAGAVVVDTRPHGVAPHQLTLASVEHLLGQPRHWLHVLDLSLAALLTRLRDIPLKVSPQRRRGQNVHPTARIERSIIGANVTIEAHASVTDSVIGDDVIVADHSVIHTSVIGDRCRTLVDTHLRRVVAMPGSTLSNLDMQDAIFGREVFLTTGVAFFHDGPGKNVEVDGVDSGRALLGGAIGRRAVLGSRALFRCGLALPAGALVVARPEEAVGKLDDASLARAAMRLGNRADDV